MHRRREISDYTKRSGDRKIGDRQAIPVRVRATNAAVVHYRCLPLLDVEMTGDPPTRLEPDRLKAEASLYIAQAPLSQTKNGFPYRAAGQNPPVIPEG